jgi:hypothetical protein
MPFQEADQEAHGFASHSEWHYQPFPAGKREMSRLAFLAYRNAAIWKGRNLVDVNA